MPKYTSRSSFKSKKKISSKREKDTIKGRTNYMKYRNAQILVKAYIKNPSDYPEVFIKDLPERDRYNYNISGDRIHPRDIFEAITISYFYANIKEWEKIPPETNRSMKKWLTNYIHSIVSHRYPRSFIEGSKEMDDVIDVLREWEDILLHGEGRERPEYYDEYFNEFIDDLLSKSEPSPIIVDLLVRTNKDLIKKYKKDDLMWDELSKADKISIFEKYRHLEHDTGFVLSYILKFENEIKFKEYMDNLRYILKE